MLLEFSVALSSKDLRLQLEGLRIPQEHFSSSDSCLIGLKRNFPLWRLCLGRVWVGLLQGSVQRGVFPLVTTEEITLLHTKKSNLQQQHLLTLRAGCWAESGWSSQGFTPVSSCLGSVVVLGMHSTPLCSWHLATPPLAGLPFFFPHVHAFCMPANTSTATFTLKSPVLVSWGISWQGTQAHQDIHTCPAIPWVIPECKGQSTPLGLKAIWKTGKVSSLNPIFTPSSMKSPSVPPIPH